MTVPLTGFCRKARSMQLINRYSYRLKKRMQTQNITLSLQDKKTAKNDKNFNSSFRF
jgi:hypothetical protein